MARIATFDKKGSHFAAKAAKTQKLGVRDGLLGVVIRREGENKR